MIDLAQLREEIKSSQACKALLAVGNDTAIAALLNELAHDLERQTVAAADLLRSLPAEAFAKLDANAVARWQLLLSLGEVSAATAAAILGEAVPTYRGSRAEQLWGRGAAVTVEQVGRAMLVDRPGGKIGGR